MTSQDDYEPPNDAGEGEYRTPLNMGPADEGEDRAHYFRRWMALPESMKDIGAGPETAEYIEEQFRPRFRLSREQTRAITSVLRDLLLADVYIGDVMREIQSRLAVNKESARTMADTLFKELLQPARSDLQALHQEKFPERSKRQ